MISKTTFNRIAIPLTLFVALQIGAQASQSTGFHLSGSSKKSMSAMAIKASEKKATKAAARDAKSLTFTTKTIRLVVQTGPSNDMMSYRISGLRNPKITVPKGATLHILFVNSDDDMLHCVRFTTMQAPFEAKPNPSDSVGGANLPPVKAGKFSTEDFVLKVPSKAGTYSYLCTVSGHAAAGMYGVLVVR